MKVIKWVLATLAAFLLLVCIAIAYLLIVVDPNTFKPRIEQLARDQDVDLLIEGDLDWQILPNLAIHIGRTELSSNVHPIPKTRLQSTALSLDLLALLQRKVAIKSINIDGADIDLQNMAQAASLAAAPAAAAGTADTGNQGDLKAIDPENEDSSGMPLALAIDELDIKNARIALPQSQAKGAGAKMQRQVIENLSLHGRNISLDGTPYPIVLRFDYVDPALPDTLSTAFESSITIEQKSMRVTAENANLNLILGDKPPIAIDLNLTYDGQADTLSVRDFQLTHGDLKTTASASAKNLAGDIEFETSLDLKATKLRHLLRQWQIDTASIPENALNRVAFSSQLQGTKQALNAKSITIQLDDTTFTGNARVRLAPAKSLTLDLKGTSLDLKRYLGDAGKDANQKATTAGKGVPGEALFAPIAAPLAWLDNGEGTIDLRLAQLSTHELTLKDLKLSLQARQKKIQLKQLGMNTLGGSVQTQGAINLQTSMPQLNLVTQMTNISLAEASAAFDTGAVIEGQLGLSLNAQTRGATVDALHNNLNGQGKLNIASPHVKSFNIEKAYCDIAALVEKVEPVKNWPAGTRLTDINADIQLAGKKITLSPYTSGLGNLSLRGNATIDLGTESFDVLAITRLSGERTSANGCVVKSKRIRDRDIPIRCRDRFDKAGASSCSPDGNIVRELLQEAVIKKISESNLDEKTGEAIEGLLRGILNR